MSKKIMCDYLKRLAELEENVIGGEWELWTSCSYSRVGIKGGTTQAIYPTVLSDGQPDIVGRDNLKLAIFLRNTSAELAAVLEAAHEVTKYYPPEWDHLVDDARIVLENTLDALDAKAREMT